MSMVNVSLKGHLFDTKAFNHTIDICEKNGVQFRVVGWEIGNAAGQDSTVTIQMMTHDKNALNNTLDEIEQVAQKAGVTIWSGEQEDA